MTCTYQRSATSTCSTDALPGSNYCEHHSTIRCVSCHAQATHNCQNVVTGICGCALCNGCAHVEGAANGMFYSHARQGEAAVLPHYAKK